MTTKTTLTVAGIEHDCNFSYRQKYPKMPVPSDMKMSFTIDSSKCDSELHKIIERQIKTFRESPMGCALAMLDEEKDYKFECSDPEKNFGMHDKVLLISPAARAVFRHFGLLPPPAPKTEET
jgi:hypothetical protein